SRSPCIDGVTPGSGVTGGSTVPVISGGGASTSGGAASTAGSGGLFHQAGAFQDLQPPSHGAHKAAPAGTRATRTPIGYSRRTTDQLSRASTRAAPTAGRGSRRPHGMGGWLIFCRRREGYSWSTIFSENRYPLFGIVLNTRPF